MNAHKSEIVQTREHTAELIGLGVDVLLDDRDNVRPGAKFAESYHSPIESLLEKT